MVRWIRSTPVRRTITIRFVPQDVWYERTTYQLGTAPYPIGTAPYQGGTLDQKYNGTAYCYGTLRTVKHSQAPDTET